MTPAHPPQPGGGRYALVWAAMALLNAARILGLSLPAGGLTVRLEHHLFDAGQLLAVGLISWGAVALWDRLSGARRGLRGLTPLLLYAAAIALAGVLLVDDLRGPAERLAEGRGWDGVGDPQPWLGLMIAGVAAAVPAAWAAGRLAARPRLRWLAVGVAAAVAVAQERILDGAYPGAHLILVWCAATLAGAALRGVSWGKAPRRPWRWAAPLALLSTLSLVVWPSNAVLMELDRLDGAILLPVLAHAHFTPETALMLGLRGAERADQPAVESTQAGLLPEGAVVVLITVDSLRADLLPDPHIAARLPTLSALATEGVNFTHARSTASGTRLAMAGIFASRLWSQLPWSNPASGRPVIRRDPSARLPEALRRAGVQTVNIVSEFRALVGAAGLARGFDEEQVLRAPKGSGQDYALAPRMIDAAIARLKRQGPEPLFLYMHLMDPHYPYDAVTEEGEPFQRYLAEVELVDGALGRLRAAIDAAGLAPRAALIVSADHGEAFGQHGVEHHNGTLYDELVRVPLLMSLPDLPPRRVDAPVSLMDLGPTVLDLMGVPTPAAFRGASLVPWLEGVDPQPERPIVMERRDVQAMLIDGRFKVILDRRKHREEIYDLDADGFELNNLRDSMGPRGDALVAQVRGYYARESTARGLIDARRAAARARRLRRRVRQRRRARRAKRARLEGRRAKEGHHILSDFKMPPDTPSP